MTLKEINEMLDKFLTFLWKWTFIVFQCVGLFAFLSGWPAEDMTKILFMMAQSAGFLAIQILERLDGP